MGLPSGSCRDPHGARKDGLRQQEQAGLRQEGRKLVQMCQLWRGAGRSAATWCRWAEQAVPLLHGSRARNPPSAVWKSRLGGIWCISTLRVQPSRCPTGRRRIPLKPPVSSRVSPTSQQLPWAMGLQRGGGMAPQGAGFDLPPSILSVPRTPWTCRCLVCCRLGKSALKPEIRSGANYQRCICCP